jgi:hypothetical protein
MKNMFSPREQRLIKILGKNAMTIAELTEFYFMDELCMSLEANNNIAGSIRRIVAKCEKNKLKWTIKSKGGGRQGKTVWRGKR